MLLTNQQMREAATKIARGIPIPDIIDIFEDEVRDNPDNDVAELSTQKLRNKLSDELNRANPRSNRFVEKYAPIVEAEQEQLQLQFAEQAAEVRNTILADLAKDIREIDTRATQYKEAAGGEWETIEPATSPDEADKMTKTWIALMNQKYKLQAAQLAVLEKLTRNTNAPIIDSEPKL